MTANTPQAHSKFSASAAHRWIPCPGSIAASAGIPDESSVFAEEGTVAHELAAMCIINGQSPWEYDQYEFLIKNGKFWSCRPDLIPDQLTQGEKDHRELQALGCTIYKIGQEMIEHVCDYIKYVETYAHFRSAKLHVEERVNYASFLGTPKNTAFGTSDIILAIPEQKELVVIDLKYGRGVEVSAEENPQLMLYALGAYNKYRFIYDIETVRMVVFQPRMQNLSEWDAPLEHLIKFAEGAKASAYQAQQAAANLDKIANYLNPGVKQCGFCRAKGTCPALAKLVLRDAVEGFEPTSDSEDELFAQIEINTKRLPQADLGKLSTYMKATDLLETWIKGVREAVFRHLKQGDDVEGFKLVEGRMGPRKWGANGTFCRTADGKARRLCKTQLDEELQKKIFSETFASPTLTEKALKKKAPEVWELLQEYITRSEPALSVAPESDARKRIYADKVGTQFDPVKDFAEQPVN